MLKTRLAILSLLYKGWSTPKVIYTYLIYFLKIKKTIIIIEILTIIITIKYLENVGCYNIWIKCDFILALVYK